MGELLNLAWSEFSTNISETFKNVRKNEEMCDVTLICDNGEISAHKLILFSGSTFFQTILTKYKHDHPLIVIKGVKINHLQQIVDFMYDGEISVAQEDLQELLEAAEDLKVKGLSLKQSKSTDKYRVPETKIELPSAPIAIKYDPNDGGNATESDDHDNNSNEEMIIKCEPQLVESDVQFEPYDSESWTRDDPLQTLTTENEEKLEEWLEVEQKKNDNLDEEALTLMVRADGPNNRVTWFCKVCKKNSSDKTRIRKHVRGKHLQKAAKKKENDINMDEKYKVSFKEDEVTLSSYEDYQVKVASLMEKVDGPNNRVTWFCRECRKNNSDKTRIRKHVEIHIQDLMFQCLYCEAKRKCSGNMDVHVYKTHSMMC